MKHVKEARLLLDNKANPMLAESRKELEKAGFSEDTIEYYLERLSGLLDDFAQKLGENTEIQYSFQKRFSRLEGKLFIHGEEYDPFETGSGAKVRKIEKILDLNVQGAKTSIIYYYHSNCNVVIASVPFSQKKKKLVKNPMIWGIILGAIVGSICLCLPETTGGFIVDEILSPVQNIVLKILGGIMGPVIFISLVTSIIALDSVNDLTDMGFKILKRFIRIILFFIVVSIGVSLIFFPSYGPDSFDFSPNQIIAMFLRIIPVNLFSPFLENNTAQLVVLAFIAGVALLLLGDRTRELNTILQQVNRWIMNIMKIVMKIVPLIPFLSISTLIAKRNLSVLLEGWKFIAAVYIVYSIAFVCKISKVSIKTKIPVKELLHKAKPMFLTAFTTGSLSAPISQAYEFSKTEFHIKPGFTSLWIPMCSAMLGTGTTVYMILGTLMAAQLCNISISWSFLVVLIIIVLELSLASPGATAAWVIVLESFSMPASYAGLFTTYRIFTQNFSAGVTTAYNLLEEVEVAYKMDEIETSQDIIQSGEG